MSSTPNVTTSPEVSQRIIHTDDGPVIYIDLPKKQEVGWEEDSNTLTIKADNGEASASIDTTGFDIKDIESEDNSIKVFLNDATGEISDEGEIIGPLSWKTGTVSGMKYGAITVQTDTLGIERLSGLKYAVVIAVIGAIIGVGLLKGAIPGAVFAGGGVWLGRKWGMSKAMNDLRKQTPQELLTDPDVKIHATDVSNTKFKTRSLLSFPKSVLKIETTSNEYRLYGDRESLETIRNALRTKDLTSDTMFCTECGTEISVETDDCPECGAAVA